MTSDQQRVAAAWLAMHQIVSKVADAMPQNFAPLTHSAVLGVCGLQNVPMKIPVLPWVADGSGSVTLSAIKVTQKPGFSISPASFSDTDPSLGHLPLHFDQLSIAASYAYSQSCARGFGIFKSTQTVSGSGTLTQSLTKGDIVFNMRIAAPGRPFLQLVDVTVDTSQGTSSLTLDPEAVDPLSQIVKPFIELVLRSAYPGLFSVATNSDFCQSLVAQLIALSKDPA